MSFESKWQAHHFVIDSGLETTPQLLPFPEIGSLQVLMSVGAGSVEHTKSFQPQTQGGNTHIVGSRFLRGDVNGDGVLAA